MTPALFAPVPTAPRATTPSGASVLPGVPLPAWALPADVVAPPAEPPVEEPAENPVENPVDSVVEENQFEDELANTVSSIAEPTRDDEVRPTPHAPVTPAIEVSGLPEFGHAAWDAPAPEPHPGSHRFVPVAESSGERAGHGRLYVALAVVAALAVAAFVAFVLPGALVSAGDDDAVVAPVVHSTPATAAPSAGGAPGHFATWASETGVTNVSKVSGLPAGTAARCGSATVEGKAGTACAFVGPKAAGSLWFPGTGRKAASQQVAATAAAQAR